MTLVVSPHLDDAVLSCFSELVCGARVVTIFAGAPPEGVEPSAWDRCCGYDDANSLMRDRQGEDLDVLGGLGVPFEQLPYLEWPHRAHGPRPEVGELAATIKAASSGGERVLVPLGVAPRPNPDHELVRDAGRLLADVRDVRLYGDLPHCLKQIGRWPTLVDPDGPLPPTWWLGLHDLAADVRPAVTRLPVELAEAKATAMRGYRTQFRPLTTMLRPPGRDVLRRPDVYAVEPRWEATA